MSAVILTSDNVRGLTLHRPWPWCFTHADKRVENRPLKPPRALVGKWLALHSGVRFDEDAWLRIRGGVYGKAASACPGPDTVLPSVITCVVSLAGYYETELLANTLLTDSRLVRNDTRALVTDRWAFGPVVIETPRVIVLPDPVPCPGMQGYWRLDGRRVPAGVFERVRDQVAAVTAAGDGHR